MDCWKHAYKILFTDKFLTQAPVRKKTSVLAEKV